MQTPCSFHLDVEQAQAIQRLAGAKGQNWTAWIRDVIERELIELGELAPRETAAAKP